MTYGKLSLKLNRDQTFYINFDISMEGWPEVFSDDQFSSFCNSKIASQQISMMAANYLGINDLWDVQKALIMDYTLHIFSALQ